MQKAEFSFQSIQSAESARCDLVSANAAIDAQMSADNLPDGEPRGSDRWCLWQRLKVREKLENEEKIRSINLWIKHKNRESRASSADFDLVLGEAKASFYALLDVAKKLREENEGLRNGLCDPAVLANDNSQSG